MPTATMPLYFGALAALVNVVFVRGFDFDGCTSIVVGRNASVDGSAMASHASDCADCDWRVVYVPAKDHAPGTMRKIYSGVWSQYPRLVDTNRSSQYTPGAGIDTTEVLGEIPEVSHTYALWEASYSLMNEHGLGMGESTCPGYLIGKGVDNGGNALFTVGNLMAIALERCKTSRCAIRTMGELGAKYGFYGEDPGKTGAGEAVTVVDKAGDAWVFHITAGVAAPPNVTTWNGQRGALWVAQRVPAGHVAVVANSFTIQEVHPTDTENFMHHPGLFDLTKEVGMYSGAGPFNWQRIMAPDLATFSYFPGMAPIPMYSTLRMWGVYRQAAPKAGLTPSRHMEDLPFSIQVDKKVSNLDVMNWFRSHYEGTEFDMRLGALAGPWQSPNRVEGGLGEGTVPGQFARSTSIPRTSYTAIMQSGIPQPVLWFAPDASATSVFVPFFCDVLSYGGRFDVETYGTGSMKSFSFGQGAIQPAWWAFDFVANYMELSYKNMSETYVYPEVQRLQLTVDAETKTAVQKANLAQTREETAAMLGLAQTQTQRHVVQQWWSLAEMLVVRYNDGFFNFGPWMPQTVGAIGYPAFWLEMIGYNQQSFYPTWFRQVANPPTLLPDAERALLRQTQTKESSPGGGFWFQFVPSGQVSFALFIGIALGYLMGLAKSAQPVDSKNVYFRIEESLAGA